MNAAKVLQRIVIAGLTELNAEDSVTHVVALVNPAFEAPDHARLYPAARRLMLRFHDEVENRPGHILPGRDDIAALIAFFRPIHFDEAGTRLLIHCHSGISRSTAAAAIAAGIAAPESDGTAIMDALLARRAVAWPNSLMLRLADEALGTSGRLEQAAHHLFRRRIAADAALFGRMIRLRRGTDLAAAGLTAATGEQASPLPFRSAEGPPDGKKQR